MGYDDIVGRGYPQMGGFGQYDIMGANGNGAPAAMVPAGPPMAGPGPFGQGGYPFAPGGFPGVNGGYPAEALGYPAGAPGFGWNGWFPGCGWGPPISPLVTQRNEDPAVLVRPRCPRVLRTQYLGFPRTCIPACETVEIECDVQVLTKIIRLVFPSDSAFQLLVHDIKIGNECLVQCGPIPASMFLEDATDAEVINTETIQPGTSVRITVQNVSNADVCLSIGAVVRVAY